MRFPYFPRHTYRSPYIIVGKESPRVWKMMLWRPACSRAGTSTARCHGWEDWIGLIRGMAGASFDFLFILMGFAVDSAQQSTYIPGSARCRGRRTRRRRAGRRPTGAPSVCVAREDRQQAGGQSMERSMEGACWIDRGRRARHDEPCLRMLLRRRPLNLEKRPSAILQVASSARRCS